MKNNKRFDRNLKWNRDRFSNPKAYARMLPMVFFRGRNYFVDVRLKEVRDAETIEPFPFDSKHGMSVLKKGLLDEVISDEHKTSIWIYMQSDEDRFREFRGDLGKTMCIVCFKKNSELDNGFCKACKSEMLSPDWFEGSKSEEYKP